MSRKFPRLAIAAVCVAGLSGSGAAVALAQSGPAPAVTPFDTTTTTATTSTGTTTGTTTTGTTTTSTATTSSSTSTPGVVLDPVIQAPTAVGPTAAVLNGTIDTDGQSGTYSFEYDTVSDYTGAQNDLSGTTATFIPAGSTSLTQVSAQIGCYPASSCSANGATPLTPDTRYEYVLTYDTGAGTDYGNQYNSVEGTFTTDKYGLIKPGSKTLRFSGKKLGFPLTCSSAVSCAGKVTVKHDSTRCASSKFNIGSGDATSLTLTLTSKCASDARRANGGRLSATLGIASTTGQPSFSEKLTLVDTKPS